MFFNFFPFSTPNKITSLLFIFLVHNNVFNSQISKTLVCIGQNEERKKVDFCPKFTLAQEPIHSLNENVCCTFEHQVIFLFDILYNPYEFVRGSLLDPADPCLIKCLASITFDVGITPGKTSLECNLVRCLPSLFSFRYYRRIPSRAQCFWLSWQTCNL